MNRIATLAACMAACTPDFNQDQINAIADRFNQRGQCEAEPADLAHIQADVQAWQTPYWKNPECNKSVSDGQMKQMLAS